jgi:uncharacterized membrane protein YhaH (DUF805 family)
MDQLSSIVSTSGRIARKPFAISVVVLYLLSFGTRALLAPSVMAQGGGILFALAQMLLIWIWYALHARRLRDAGRGRGSAVGIAIVYGFGIALVMLVALLLNPPASGGAPDGGPPAAGLAELLLLLYLIALLTGQPHLGVFGYVLIGIAVLVLAPIVIALLFSLWAGTRPSLQPAP